ncbi:MAG: LysR family transcriptional regulator [Lachnospiraceae bacterium]|nr:LysR family transcriptional regulator [Lachnospiraceae bacterium]
MTLQQLYYVIVISETGALSKAAEVLYISQPSLSGAVQELEKELGFALFHRNGHGMALTNDGMEFITYARQVYYQYETLLEKYGKTGKRKKKFGISTQHYSFAVKSFVEMVKQFNTTEYEFAIRETKTREVIDDVHTSRSEIGIIYLSDFNRKIITNLLKANNLEFHKLIDCNAYVYIWKGHPLAQCKSIRFAQLADYPCLSFEQGSESSFYLAEEILSTENYPRTIKANDRATMLNLMIGLNGYTLCSGIICEELNGDDYLAVPFEADEDNPNSRMEIGYIVKKNLIMSQMGELYIEEMKRYLKQYEKEEVINDE